MKNWSVVFLTALLAFTSMEADARRLGGGGSFGRQSGSITQRQAAPPASAAQQDVARRPVQQQPPQSATQQQRANGAAPQQASRRSLLGPVLGGLAAGLGLSWLASQLGLGAAFGEFLLLLLLVFIALTVFRMLARARRQPRAQATARQGGAEAQQYAAAGAPADMPSQVFGYNPATVGNDASARPWEYDDAPGSVSAASSLGLGNVVIGAKLGTSPPTWGIPEGFDVKGFETSAKVNFEALQAAWDRADRPALREMMTDELFTEINRQLDEREARADNRRNSTAVVMLEARLLGIEEHAQDHLASVEFSGLISEDPSAGSAPFREAWNMSKAKDGNSGWLVAGIQALE